MRVVFLYLLVFLSGCAGTKDIQESAPALGTFVEITVADRDKSDKAVKEAIGRASQEISRVEQLLSRFIPQSDISRINISAGVEPVKVSAETISVLEQAIRFSQLTGGAFDVTIYPLLEVWGITDKGKKDRQVPTDSQIKQALSKVGYKYIEINQEQNTVFLPHQGMSIDLGGIAAGYAVDRAIKILKEAGIHSALINAGGDIYALGAKGRAKWQIGLRHPRRSSEMLATLALRDRAVATSGDYQNFVEIKGRRYSHIVNPRTGYPCAEVPASVTVLANDCITVDALSTAVFVLGPEKGQDLIEQLKGTEVIIGCIAEGRLIVYASEGLKKEINLPKDLIITRRK
ncbi:MAG: FAD:protein FMN transferase [Candidatus Omnitrophota bacterium]